MKTHYLAQNGAVFADAAECAEYELSKIPGLRDKLNGAVNSAPLKARWNWCGSAACACSGCINRTVYSAGFSYEHWNIWQRDNPRELYNTVDVWLTSAGINRIPVIQVISREYQLSLHVARSLLDTLPYLLAKSVSEVQAESLVQKFRSVGAHLRIDD